MTDLDTNNGYSKIPHFFIDDLMQHVGPLATVVYWALQRHANEAGNSWPSQATLAKKCRLSRQSIINQIKILVDFGLIRVETRLDRTSNFYTFVPFTDIVLPIISPIGCTRRVQPEAEVVHDVDIGCTRRVQPEAEVVHDVDIGCTRGIQPEAEVVHDVDIGCTRGVQGLYTTCTGVVNDVYMGCTPRVHKEEPIKKNQLKRTNEEEEERDAPKVAARSREAPRKESTRFQKPHFEEVLAYFVSERAGNHAKKYYDYYESNGWRVGKNPMRNWQASARNWIARDADQKSSGGTKGTTLQDMALENKRRVNSLVERGLLPRMQQELEDE